MQHPDEGDSHATEGADLALETLEPLDLRKCDTLSHVVEGYRRCSFGARMLGEVAATWEGLLAEGKPPALICDCGRGDPLRSVLTDMHRNGLCDGVLTPEEYATRHHGGTAVVIGEFTGRQADMLFKKPDRTIFINAHGHAKPGQVRDGFFPDAVFSDPHFITSLLLHTLKERTGGPATDIPAFLRGLQQHDGLSQHVCRGAETFRAMVEDPECERFLTVSGAMTVAQMSHVIEDTLTEKMFHSVTTTGALMAHGLMPGMGLRHYKYNPVHSDVLLARRKLNRVTDTLEPETNFDQAADVIDAVLSGIPDGQSMSTSHFHWLIGKYLHEHFPDQRGILKTAYEQSIPVFVPAFVDSELGNDVFTHNLARKLSGRAEVDINPRLDQQVMVERMTRAPRMGVFSVGGGVPRNHIQNLAPLLEIANARVPEANFPKRMFTFGTRIAPDELYIGHLSGCSYDENTSWRKFDPDARKAEIKADATIIWPLLVKYVMETRRV